MLPFEIAIFAFAALFIYFYFSVWRIRGAARRILESMRKNFPPERDIHVIDPESLPGDTPEKYAGARTAVEGLGFSFVCFAEDETFTRVNGMMVPFQYFRNGKGDVKVATYFPQRVGYMIYDFMTELSDGRQITTNNAAMAAKIIAPPIFVRKHLPPDAPPSEILGVHNVQVGKTLRDSPGITCSTAVTPEAILERYRRYSRIGYEFHRDRGWISLEELVGLAPGGSEASARKIYAAIQKMLRDEDEAMRHSPSSH